MMSDCPKCWDTPCSCGHGYREWSAAQLRAQIGMLQRVLDEVRLKEGCQPMVDEVLSEQEKAAALELLRQAGLR